MSMESRAEQVGKSTSSGSELAVNDAWIAKKLRKIDVSGIRKAFDLSKTMTDPINLSIGLPDFDVPRPVKNAAISAIEQGHNAYTVTQGAPELKNLIQAQVDSQFGHRDRSVLVTTGTAGCSHLLFRASSIQETRQSSSIPISGCIPTSSRWQEERLFSSTLIPTFGSTFPRLPMRSLRGPSAY